MQRMLTCSTVRKKDSWQNDWSQGFRLCDQEEFPYCDTCVKVPYQSHIWYGECGSTSAVPATHYCWVQVCLSMTHVLIIPRDMRLLAPCYNMTSKWHAEISTTFKYSNPPGCQLHLCWRCSDPQNSMKNWADLWGKYIEYVKNEIWPTNVLFDGYPGVPSTKDNFHLRWKKSSGSNSSYLKEAT